MTFEVFLSGSRRKMELFNGGSSSISNGCGVERYAEFVTKNNNIINRNRVHNHSRRLLLCNSHFIAKTRTMSYAVLCAVISFTYRSRSKASLETDANPITLI